MPGIKRVGDHWVLVPMTLNQRDNSDPSAPVYHADFDVIDGVLEARRVECVAVEGGRSVRQGDLTKFKIADATEEYMALMGRKSTDVAGRISGGEGWTVVEMTDDPADRRTAISALRRARRERKDLDLEKVARIYRDAAARPTAAVAAEFGVAHRTASLYAQRARDAGLLPPSAHGRKGT